MKIINSITSLTYNFFSKHPISSTFVSVFAITYTPLYAFLIYPTKLQALESEQKLQALNSELSEKEIIIESLLFKLENNSFDNIDNIDTSGNTCLLSNQSNSLVEFSGDASTDTPL